MLPPSRWFATSRGVALLVAGLGGLAWGACTTAEDTTTGAGEASDGAEGPPAGAEGGVGFATEDLGATGEDPGTPGDGVEGGGEPEPEDGEPTGLPDILSPVEPTGGEPEASGEPSGDAADGEPDPVLPDAECIPDCVDKLCGPDGCGSLCGYCEHPLVCGEEGLCIEICVQQCEGKICGPDGCGGICGTCDGDLLCGDDGLCYEADCEPECSGKVCGPDGCGSDCGLCAEPNICVNGGCALGPCGNVSKVGECQGNVAVWCEQKVILKEEDCDAWDNYACKYDAWIDRFTCQDKGDCVPSCVDKKCGGDGCGGICPPGCDVGWSCPGGECAPEQGAECGDITELGECSDDDTSLWFCAGGVLYELNCEAIGQECGWSLEAESFDCQ